MSSPPSVAAEEPIAAVAVAVAARAPRRARGQLRVDALLASAADVFADKGFDAATMTEIAAQANSSIGSLYQFFRTKEAVADALLAAQLEDLLRRFEALGEQAPALTTVQLGQTLARLFVEFRAANRSFGTLVERPGPVSMMMAEARRRVRDRIEHVLVRHAPHVDRALLHAMAPALHFAMKAGVELQKEISVEERPAAEAEVAAMLTGYLTTRLGPDRK